MNQRHRQLHNSVRSVRTEAFIVLLSLPLWTACSSINEETDTLMSSNLGAQHEIVSNDEFAPNNWLRISVIDRFDDSLTKRILYYSTEDSKTLLLERNKEESDGLTKLLVSFPRELLSWNQRIARGETYSAAMDRRMKDDHEFYPTIPVSFNFKRYDEDDIRVLDEEFKDSKIFDGMAKSIDLRNDYETGLNSYFVTALRDSYEVRIKAEFGYFRLDFKVDLENFNEQYTWLTEVCKDEKIDVAVSVD
ncbi:MAG: hypothetical protein F4Z01_00050 [Gammaproteobacteria bacterium]|nr:hypothetical protein [Gammaproteobacteria bacterium]MYF38712.1 hypothetical protein [Gammaproteobacteria bacterium]